MMVPILMAETFGPRAEMLASRKAKGSTSLQIVQPEGIEDGDLDFFQVIFKLFSQGINALDVKILGEASRYDYDDLKMYAKKILIGYSGLQETKVDIICEATKFDRITGSHLANRKPVIRVATANQGLEWLGGVIETMAMTESASKFWSCKTQLAYTLGVSLKELLGPASHSLLSHSPRIGDDVNCKGSVEPGDMDSTDSSSGNNSHDSGDDNVPLMPAANGHRPPIPPVFVGHYGDGDQALTNLRNGGDPWISLYIDGQHVDDFSPIYARTPLWLVGRLSFYIYYHQNGLRMRAVGFRITYWSLGSRRLLIPINADSLSPQWQAFRNALRRVNVDTNAEP